MAPIVDVFDITGNVHIGMFGGMAGFSGVGVGAVGMVADGHIYITVTRLGRFGTAPETKY